MAFGRSLHELRLAGSARNERWTAELKSREMTGRFDWSGEGKGRLAGRIAQLVLPASTAPAATAGGSALADEVDELPALDLTFDRFVFGERDFGSVRIVAENTGNLWHATIDVQNADVTLNADGRWRRGTDAPETQVDFKLKAGSIENTLKRIGYPNAVRRGSATLEGKLTWDAAPVSPDIPTLAGSIRFEARDGQFAKLEPGVGRLLGVISLQSLPRRITLDFRDVFSEGFAFDRIEGEATLARGVADTRDLEIRGPAARVAMQTLFMGLLLSAATGLLGVLFAGELLRILGADDATVATGLSYTRCLLGGMPTVLLLFLLNAVFRGAGDAATAMHAATPSPSASTAGAPTISRSSSSSFPSSETIDTLAILRRGLSATARASPVTGWRLSSATTFASLASHAR